jgi:hypothetical protein
VPCVGPSQVEGGNEVQSIQSNVRQVVAWAYLASVKVWSQKSVEGRLRRLLSYVGVLCLPIIFDWQDAGSTKPGSSSGNLMYLFFFELTFTADSHFFVHTKPD